MRILHVTAVMASSYGGPKVVVETLLIDQNADRFQFNRVWGEGEFKDVNG